MRSAGKGQIGILYGSALGALLAVSLLAVHYGGAVNQFADWFSLLIIPVATLAAQIHYRSPNALRYPIGRKAPQ